MSVSLYLYTFTLARTTGSCGIRRGANTNSDLKLGGKPLDVHA